MKRTTITTLAVASLGIGTTHAVTVAWDNGGGDSSWQTAANWDNDIVPGDADDITINTGAAVIYTPAGDLSIDGGSFTISGGSSWTQTAPNWSRINNGIMTLDDATFTRTGGGNLVLAFNANSSGAISATNSTISIGGELWFGHVDNTGNQTAQLNLINSTIDANGGVGIWFWDNDASGSSMNLNIVGAGSTVEGRVGRRNSVEVSSTLTWETLWDEGVLQYNGGNSGSFADHFTTSGIAGTDGYSLKSVPEPSSTVLLGLGSLAIILRRRK